MLYWQLRSLVLMLCDPDKVRKHGCGQLALAKPSSADLFAAAPAAVPTTSVDEPHLPVLPAEDGYDDDDDDDEYVPPTVGPLPVMAPAVPVPVAQPTSFFF